MVGFQQQSASTCVCKPSAFSHGLPGFDIPDLHRMCLPTCLCGSVGSSISALALLFFVFRKKLESRSRGYKVESRTRSCSDIQHVWAYGGPFWIHVSSSTRVSDCEVRYDGIQIELVVNGEICCTTSAADEAKRKSHDLGRNPYHKCKDITLSVHPLGSPNPL